jgi:hypothetical protein
MWWILKRSNPGMLHIYEPLSPDLFKLNNEPFSHLHGLPVWEDYHKPEFKKIEKEWTERWKELQNRYEWDVLPRDVGEVTPLFDLLHELEIPVVIQPNRCHLILDSIAKRYGCKFIHIIRNPIDTWVAHTIEPALGQPTLSNIIKKEIKKILFSIRTNRLGRYVLLQRMAKRSTIGKSYYLDSVYKLISQYFGFNRAGDFLDKMLIVWTYVNYEAWKQVSSGNRGKIVYYEYVVRNPDYWFRVMEKFSGIRFDRKYTRELSPRFITVSDELREAFVKRLDDLGLLRMVKKFYPPERWFG